MDLLLVSEHYERGPDVNETDFIVLSHNVEVYLHDKTVFIERILKEVSITLVNVSS